VISQFIICAKFRRTHKLLALCQLCILGDESDRDEISNSLHNRPASDEISFEKACRMRRLLRF